ncbi:MULTISPECIES: histidine ammonia-lyase [unclassified Polaribacter]|jgi:histidine ammonia-lyase|uniref:histidine ammonia-lyase n=1 Tax=unclassified Polaribacter TaxID=196858 RepID=UPI00056CECCA|nr:MULTISPECIES: histidine ammonia-lyase [unclassified Polaribacter]MBT3741986.1 histidine ammonia-lyase [Polaribacter sp.]MBT4413874.1 histidine ammonia-lyase [Polaribacter sp.]MBT7817146.1 histidine ammonia-lyase [Polaribacter sp.]MDG1195872.1 histidine ammonia-lyase [Polaribacter sp.]MDG1404548.1 histidine ammonia-lyase [Polaribacter sp.]
MISIHYINSTPLDLSKIQEIISLDVKLALSETAIQKIKKCRSFLDVKTKSISKPIYGINTGFGALYNVKIKDNNLQKLQENLVMSHACGTGDEVPKEIVKLMILFKVQALSYGHSGVQLATVNRLIDFYNNDIIPVIYTQGSLGASGDLSPLAHLSLPLIGLGKVYYKGEIISSEELLKVFSWDKISLQSKEGLALLNGTQFMSAYGIHCLLKAHKLSYLADLIGTISLEGFDGRIEPFNELIHFARPHNGQIKTAQRIKDFLEESELIVQEKQHVQDPYSFRCMPQVHGATKDTIRFVTKTFLTEINSVTDNPNIFVDEDEIISGGNFHGQPLALGLDFLAIALAELGNISERRTYQLVSGHRHLPPFLISNPGLNSGFMIPQYTAASIVSQNKQYATPASVDSIESSNGQEDHVSMGANAATKCKKIVDNLQSIFAIELFTASQALSFGNGKSSPFLESIMSLFRQEVTIVEEDRVLHDDIVNASEFINSLEIDSLELFG